MLAVNQPGVPPTTLVLIMLVMTARLVTGSKAMHRPKRMSLNDASSFIGWGGDQFAINARETVSRHRVRVLEVSRLCYYNQTELPVPALVGEESSGGVELW